MVSFIIPAYNVERYIKKTLDSLLNQTDKDFEIIVVNDGSEDNTFNVAEEILSRSGFKNYKIINKEHKGASSARNRGINEASGEYLVFLDGDDYVGSDLVYEIKNIVGKMGEMDIILWKFSKVDENGKELFNEAPMYGLKEGMIYTGIEVLKKLLIEGSFSIWTANCAYSKKLIINSGIYYNEKLYYFEEYEFGWRILTKGKRVVFLDKVLTFYLNRPGSLSSTLNITKRCNAYFSRIETLKFYNSYLPKSYEIKLMKHGIEEDAVFIFLTLFLTELKGCSYKKAISKIDKMYPGLFEDALSRARSLKKFFIIPVSIKQRIYFSLFKISPRICFFTHKIYNMIKNLWK